MIIKTSFKVICIVLILTAVTSLVILVNGTAGEKIPSPSKAISVAKNHTPLTSVIKDDVTPPGPRKRVIYGTDAEDKEMAVWVRNATRTPVYIYLELGVTEQDVIMILESQGVKTSDISFIVLDYDELTLQDNLPSDYYWVAYTIQEERHVIYHVDFYKGNISKKLIIMDSKTTE